jgi:carboxyl-terminal processing protease
LGFEALDAQARPLGWSSAGGGADLASDVAAAEGERSLKVTRAAAAGVARVSQRVPAALLRAGTEGTARLRLTGLARAPASGVAPAIWLRVDGPRGPLFLDSGGYGREPTATELTPGSAAASDGSSEWRRYELELPLPSDADEIAFGVSVRGQGSAWFDGLELSAVVTDAWPPPGPAAARYVYAALALMREHSLRRAEVDWRVLRAEALEHARGATTAAEAHLAVRFAVRELGDRHSYLQSAAATRVLATTAVSNARTGSPPTAPHGRRLGENLAYLHVPGFAGGTPLQQVEFAETMKNTIQANDGSEVCGWVVDLRQNTGGNLWPMLAGLGPLLGEGTLAAAVYPEGRQTPIWYRDGQAGFGDYTQLRVRAPYRVGAAVPVAVLLGGATASSAEVLAVAFRSRPLTRSFGVATRGLSAGNRTFALADGASLVLTVAATIDTAGRMYAGPIVPDEIVVGTREPSRAEAPADPALEAGMAWLAAGDFCR